MGKLDINWPPAFGNFYQCRQRFGIDNGNSAYSGAWLEDLEPGCKCNFNTKRSHDPYNAEVIKDDGFIHLSEKKDLPSGKEALLSQDIYDSGNKQKKITKVLGLQDNHEVKSVQEAFADGSYKVARYSDGKRISGYEYTPFKRKFAMGLKGKLQRLATKIATNANGYEKNTIMKNIGGMCLSLAKHIK